MDAAREDRRERGERNNGVPPREGRASRRPPWHKSSNVLLFDKDVAKMGDFDVSNQSPVTWLRAFTALVFLAPWATMHRSMRPNVLHLLRT
jgi:hypothetical protein